MKCYTIRSNEGFPEVILVETSNNFGDQILEVHFEYGNGARKILGTSTSPEGSHYGEKTKILWAKRILKESGL